MNLSSTHCPRCSKAVYAAEQVIGPGRKMYHKQCLTCTSCNTRIAPGSVQEHEKEPYCRNCHLRMFSTRDLRHGNQLSPVTSPTSSPARTVGTSSAPSTPPQIRLSGNNKSSSPTRLFAVSPTPTGGSVRVPKMEVTRIECPRCQKAVYHAEQINAVGKKWHRTCLQCTNCSKRLDSHNLCDKDGEPYCRACYAKTHGPAGSGYALLGKAGG